MWQMLQLLKHAIQTISNLLEITIFLSRINSNQIPLYTIDNSELLMQYTLVPMFYGT